MMHPEDEANTDAPLVPDLRPTNRDRPTRRIDERSTDRTRTQMEERTAPRQRAEPPGEMQPPLHRELAAINERLSNIEARLPSEEGRR